MTLYSYTINVILFLCINLNLFSQANSRIEGTILSKETLRNGVIQVNSGKFYYDTKFRKVVYDMTFPVKETVVQKDTVTYYFENDKLKKKIVTYTIPEASIFHLALTGKILNFGLESKNVYKIDKYEKKNGEIIVNWKPKIQLDKLGPLKMLLKGNRLEAILFYGPKNNLVAKQFYKNYTNQMGIDFPGEIIFINIVNNKEQYRIIKYQNIKVNDFKTDKYYNFNLGAIK